MIITHAKLKNVPELANLFDQYRVFYGQKTDIKRAVSFITDRLNKKDSVIFVAHEGSNIVGFTQLYPSFSSTAMKHIWVLNDLFVSHEFRRQKVAQQLMEAARKHATATGAHRIDLATQTSNQSAQKLYTSQNYIKDESFFHYSLKL